MEAIIWDTYHYLYQPGWQVVFGAINAFLAVWIVHGFHCVLESEAQDIAFAIVLAIGAALLGALATVFLALLCLAARPWEFGRPSLY